MSITQTTIREKKSRDQGFTLIEVLVAISILAVGLLAVASMQISAIKVNSSADNLSKRTTWAQSKLEELMVLPYSSVTSGTENTSDGYTISWTSVNDNPRPGLKLVTVSVTGGGKTTEIKYIKASL
jgi:type IV pilus assembly protein PilV